MSQLAQTLREEIHRRGAIPFSRFMEIALYCPESGYYERSSIGRRGDFYTSVSTGHVFGQLLTFQFAEWLEHTPLTRLQLVEAGAHDGALARDVLKSLRDDHPSLFTRVEYWILEPSSRRAAWQRRILEEFAGQVRWFPDWESVPASGIVGVIFSNELLDAFPVRIFDWDAQEQCWFERAVRNEGDDFAWTKARVPDVEVAATMQTAGVELTAELLAVLPDQFTLEVSPSAGQWWRDAARALNRGRLMTIDYGGTAEELVRPERGRGTLRCYHRHGVSTDVLTAPGDRDLTAHVNFTQLQHIGEASGLKTDGLWPQGQFLTGIVERMLKKSPPSKWSGADVRQFQTLTHPEHLGRAFRVLVQSR